MDVVESILLVVGVVLVIIGYAYNKAGTSQKKAKIPDNYTEYIGICKKHVEKDGKFHEMFEISTDGKPTDGKPLKYNFPDQDSKDQLREIDSIEKFYVNNDNHKDIKVATDFASKKASISKKRQYTSYVIAGAGLICIAIVLINIDKSTKV